MEFKDLPFLIQTVIHNILLSISNAAMKFHISCLEDKLSNSWKLASVEVPDDGQEVAIIINGNTPSYGYIFGGEWFSKSLDRTVQVNVTHWKDINLDQFKHQISKAERIR